MNVLIRKRGALRDVAYLLYVENTELRSCTDKMKKHADFIESFLARTTKTVAVMTLVKRINSCLCFKISAFVIVFSMVLSAMYNRLRET